MLLKLPNNFIIDVMKLFATDDYCSARILVELGRTPGGRQADEYG